MNSGASAGIDQLKTKRMFLRNAFERILREKDVRKSSHAQLKKACEAALEELKAEIQNRDLNTLDTQRVVPSKATYVDADRYFLPFELACQSKSSKIAVIALDCLQKLLAYGHLTGNSVDPQDPDRILIGRIVKAICDCFVGPHTDDTVQLQIIKALLTLVSSSLCQVHEGSLLLCVRTCYSIYLASRNLINQATAKATLTQMLTVSFSRMENAGAARTAKVDDPLSVCTALLNDLVAEVCFQLDHQLNGLVGPLTETSGEMAITEASNDASAFGSVGSLSRESFDTHSNISVDLGGSGQLTFSSVEEKDCFQLFRALCRLSMKHLNVNQDPKSHEVRSRILSLQLILSVIQNAGPVFRRSDVFVLAIKHYLCVALSRNGVSSILEVFEISLAIFLALMENFKEYLKAQIEVFFQEIFLNILDAPSSSFEHKWIVMQALLKITADAQSVVDIYVNYDCDLASSNIFERLINDLSKIAQGRHATELGAAPGQENVMRIKGLECLVSVLRCMVQWSQELYVNPASQSNLTEETSGIGNGIVRQGSGSNVSGMMYNDPVYQFEEMKHQKEILERGIELFNRNPKHGLKFFQERAIVGTNAWDIAAFFHTEERLDKAVVGDYLGDGDSFNKEVMYAYIDQMDFSGKEFVSALRLFLEGFRLPGEAQKIDRLMEKFASRYCENNPDLGLFVSADTAYVLAYSIIMLTTDLHSPQVRNKMTKEQYIRMNRGINDSADLPEQYLSDIYDEIAGNEIKMKHNSSNSFLKPATGVSNDKRRHLYYSIAMEQMATTAKALIEAASHFQGSFTSATHAQHVGPMFKVAWSPCLAAFSVGLQDSNDNEISVLCLEGFRCAIRIACIFHMETERDAYVQALARFTLLTALSGLTEMKAKNIDTLKTLITVAQTDGNYLGNAWLEIFKCISQLELAQLISTGVRSKSVFGHSMYNRSVNDASTDGFSAEYVMRSSGMNVDQKKIPVLQESLGETSSQSVVVAVDRIFTGSTKLDGEAIVHFVTALCHVSMDELNNPAHPRMYCLQKIVEISYYNMGRIRLQWSRIWEVLGDHFNKAGYSQNAEVAIFAVDSLRQLSMKFLELGELPNFRFQKDFLRPFEFIMKRNRSPTIKDMIVRCMTQMVSSQAKNIRSGWKNVFSVFHLAASEQDASILELAFRTASDIVGTIFEQHFASVLDSFQDAVKCLSEFACNPSFPDVSMEAIRLIRLCAKHVVQNTKMFQEHQWEDGNIPAGERVWLRGWLPILFELSCIINRCKLDVRTRGLTVMFEIMKTYGGHFQSNWWYDLFQIVFRIFDVMKMSEQQSEKVEWMTTTCNHALFAVVDVFTQYYAVLQSVILQDLYAQLFWCIEQSNEQLARSAVNCFENFVVSNGPKFSVDVWEKTIFLMISMFRSTLPQALAEQRPLQCATGKVERPASDTCFSHVPAVNSRVWPNGMVTQSSRIERGTGLDASKSSTELKCALQLEIISTVDAILFFPSTSRKDDEQNIAEAQGMSVYDKDTVSDQGMGMYSLLEASQLFSIADCLTMSYSTAKQYNSDDSQNRPQSSGKDRFDLVPQEVRSLACLLRLLFRMFVDEDRLPCIAETQSRLISVCHDALNCFAGMSGSEERRYSWTPVVILLLHRTIKLKDEHFKLLSPAVYGDICALIDLNIRTEIRTLLRKFFLRLH